MAGQAYHVAYDLLLGAVEHLAFSDLPMRARLEGAVRYGRKLRRRDVPHEAWPRLHRLLNRLNRGAGCAGGAGLSDAEVQRCAKEFVAIFNMVSTEQRGTTRH